VGKTVPSNKSGFLLEFSGMSSNWVVYLTGLISGSSDLVGFLEEVAGSSSKLTCLDGGDLISVVNYFSS
jgi:hypothetical protein